MSGLGQVKVQTAQRFTAGEVSCGLDGKHNNSLVCVQTTRTEVRTDHPLRPTHIYHRDLASGQEQKAYGNLQDGIAIPDERALFTAQDFCIVLVHIEQICRTPKGDFHAALMVSSNATIKNMLCRASDCLVCTLAGLRVGSKDTVLVAMKSFANRGNLDRFIATDGTGTDTSCRQWQCYAHTAPLTHLE